MTSRKADGNNKVIDNLVSAVSALDPTGASGFILGSIKSILSIRDRAYVSKFEKFWSAFEENKIEVDEFISKTEEQEDWQKVGENFLLVMDSFSTFDKCYYYGKVWIAWLKKEINTNEFIELTELLRNIFITDLHYILYNLKDRGFTHQNEDRLYNCGFLQRKKMDPFIRMSGGGGSFGIFGDDSGRDLRKAQKTNEKLIKHLENPYIVASIGKKLIEILTKK
jgi:hypothetical protein